MSLINSVVKPVVRSSVRSVFGGAFSPTYSAYFVDSMPAGWVHSRGGTATYIDSGGIMQTAATDVARFDYDIATGEPLGLLLEGSRTNYVLASGDLTNATYWGGTNVTATGGQTSVDNGSGAVSLAVTGGTNNYGQTFACAASNYYTFSFWVKEGTLTDPKYGVTGDVSGVIVADTDYSSQLVTGEWRRVKVSALAGASDTTLTVNVISNSVNSGTVVIDKVQCELIGTDATWAGNSSSYIETTTVAVARSADIVPYYDLTGIVTQNEGAVICRYSSDNTNRWSFYYGVNDAAGNGDVSLRQINHNSGRRGLYANSSTVIVSDDYIASVPESFDGFTFKNGEQHIYGDGNYTLGSGTAALAFTTTKYLALGDSITGSTPYTHVKEIHYYNKFITSTKLMSIIDGNSV